MTRHEMSLFSIVMGDAALAQAEQNIRWLHHRIEDSYCGDRLLWAWLTPDACLVQAESGSTPEGFREVYRRPLAPVEVGQRVEVLGVVCPTVCTPRPGAKRGVRRPLPPERWPDWYTRKLSGALDVDGCRVERLRKARAYKGQITATVQQCIAAASGTVVDVEALDRLRLAGVGTGKAYGCGLVVVR